MFEIDLKEIQVTGEPRKKKYEASPFLPERTGYYIPFNYKDRELMLHVVETNDHYKPIAIYGTQDVNSVIPEFALHLHAISKVVLKSIR